MTLKTNRDLSKTKKYDKSNRNSKQLVTGGNFQSVVHEEKNDVDCRDKPTVETGGPKGLEPTRYGDWEQKGRCTDF